MEERGGKKNKTKNLWLSEVPALANYTSGKMPCSASRTTSTKKAKASQQEPQEEGTNEHEANRQKESGKPRAPLRAKAILQTDCKWKSNLPSKSWRIKMLTMSYTISVYPSKHFKMRVGLYQQLMAPHNTI